MLELTRPFGARVRSFVSAAVSFSTAREPWQLDGYWALRHEVFCRETQLFHSQLAERDAHDAHAIPLVALDHWAGAALDVVGAVRIYETADEPGVWYGGRLGVASAYRAHGKVGGGLIALAVGTARAHGCTRFLANVLAPNRGYFERHHFSARRELELCGQPHVLMQAELAHFPVVTRELHA